MAQPVPSRKRPATRAVAAALLGVAIAGTPTIEAYRTPGGGQAHFGVSTAPVFGHITYIAVVALILNVAVSAVLTVVFRKTGLQDGYDETRPADYTADPVPARPASARAKTPAAPSAR